MQFAEKCPCALVVTSMQLLVWTIWLDQQWQWKVHTSWYIYIYIYIKTGVDICWKLWYIFSNGFWSFLHDVHPHLLQACPEAAQLALLLRAEERLPAREADLPLLDFGEARTQMRSLPWSALESLGTMSCYGSLRVSADVGYECVLLGHESQGKCAHELTPDHMDTIGYHIFDEFVDNP